VRRLLGLRVGRLARPQQLGERLEAALARDHRPRAALRLEREVQVLERLLRGRGREPRPQRVGELPLLLHRLHDRRAALLELAQVLRAIAHVAELHLVEAARGLLAVAGDERERVPLVEEGERLRHLARREGELGADLLDEGGGEHAAGTAGGRRGGRMVRGA
jgi:hypothetical protein